MKSWTNSTAMGPLFLKWMVQFEAVAAFLLDTVSALIDTPVHSSKLDPVFHLHPRNTRTMTTSHNGTIDVTLSRELLRPPPIERS